MFKTMAQIRQANRTNGHYFFSAGAMGFFNSRVEGGPYHGAYFITSEAEGPDRERRYTVRGARHDGAVFNVGEFMAHATKDDALQALNEWLAQ